MTMLRRAAGFWLAHVAFWAAALAVNLLLVAVFAVADPPGFVAAEIGLCLVATAAMRDLSHRPALLARLGVSRPGLMAGGVILATVLVAGGLLLIRPWFALPAPSRAEVVARAAITFSMLTTWCAFYFGYQLVRERFTTELRAAQAESLALRNELRHLQAQISPHFLFGTSPEILCPAPLRPRATLRDPRPRRPDRPHPLRAAQTQSRHLGRARPRPQVHAAGSHWRRRTHAV